MIRQRLDSLSANQEARGGGLCVRGVGVVGVKGKWWWGKDGGVGGCSCVSAFGAAVSPCLPLSPPSFFSGTICPREENVTLPCQLSLHPAQPSSPPPLSLTAALAQLALLLRRSKIRSFLFLWFEKAGQSRTDHGGRAKDGTYQQSGSLVSMLPDDDVTKHLKSAL